MRKYKPSLAESLSPNPLLNWKPPFFFLYS